MSEKCFFAADIMLPEGCDMKKWSVVACDQYTSEPEYWRRVDAFVGDAPSTLRMIVPEQYLNDPDVGARIASVHAAMEDYTLSGAFTTLEDAMIYVRRTQDDGAVRRGLVGMIDLEKYDYNKGSQSLIRATEGTVVERIPPRLRVRDGAKLELPHVMLLIDDPGDTVIGPLEGGAGEKVYDFDLMERGGHIEGRLLSDGQKASVEAALDALADRDSFAARYGADKGVLLFAVGDGNHSLATAKEHFERIKARIGVERAACHPARFALCEVVNVHDAALKFEPIHRVVFNVEPADLLGALREHIMSLAPCGYAPQRITAVCGGERCDIEIPNPDCNLAVGTLQRFLDEYIASSGGKIDYIHGEDVVSSLTGEAGDRVGFLLPPVKKTDLFDTVVLDGVLPRKTFSMGHAHDKRFYLECRAID